MMYEQKKIKLKSLFVAWLLESSEELRFKTIYKDFYQCDRSVRILDRRMRQWFCPKL